MLKELNSIANGMLGLHGYPLQPLAWGEMFGRKRGSVADAAAPTRADATAKTAVARGARAPFGTRTAPFGSRGRA